MEILLTLLSFWLGSSLPLAHADGADPKPRSDWDFSEIRKTPVHVGGRLKPFDSYARDNVLFLTGNRRWDGWDPVDLHFSWISFPDFWQKQALIRIQHPDVRKQLMVDASRTRFTPEELFRNPVLMQYANTILYKPNSQEPMGGQKQGARDQELRRVVERLTVFRNLLSGDAWLVVPKPEHEPWEALRGDETVPTRKAFAEVIKAYHVQDAARFLTATQSARKEIEGALSEESRLALGKISAEVLYNSTHLFFWAWIFYLVASFAWVFQAKLGGPIAGWTTMGLAFGLHTLGFILRIYVSGRPPVSNMYESVLWVSYGTLIFAFFVYAKFKQPIIFAVASFVSALMMLAVDASPAIMDPGIHPLVPVLRSNYWLTIHVLTITLGYSAFALALGIGNVALFQTIRQGMGLMGAEACRTRVAQLNLFAYRAIQIGVVQLAAGTILGGVWADYSWGRFWGWDPKEVWALIALLTYVILLHARMTGWVGQFGFAVGGVLGFLSVLMAWYGVNFVLGAGLHSYGFAQGGQGVVAGYAIVQLGYVGWAAWTHSHLKRS